MHWRRASPRRSARSASPAVLALLANDLLKQTLAGCSVAWVGRQEHHANAVVSWGRQADAGLSARRAAGSDGGLQQDAGTVAGVFLAAAGAAVLQVEEDLDRFLHQIVGFAALQIDNEADAARIVFQLRIV